MLLNKSVRLNHITNWKHFYKVKVYKDFTGRSKEKKRRYCNDSANAQTLIGSKCCGGTLRELCINEISMNSIKVVNKSVPKFFQNNVRD